MSKQNHEVYIYFKRTCCAILLRKKVISKNHNICNILLRNGPFLGTTVAENLLLCKKNFFLENRSLLTTLLRRIPISSLPWNQLFHQSNSDYYTMLKYTLTCIPSCYLTKGSRFCSKTFKFGFLPAYSAKIDLQLFLN